MYNQKCQREARSAVAPWCGRACSHTVGRAQCYRYTLVSYCTTPCTLQLALLPKAISYTVGFRQSKAALFDWILLVLLIFSRVDFVVFVLFLEAVGLREYCCMAVENRLAALCSAHSSQATRASRATNRRPSGLVALGLAESHQSYSRRSRCWQNGIENARYCCRVIHAACERS